MTIQDMNNINEEVYATFLFKDTLSTVEELTRR